MKKTFIIRSPDEIKRVTAFLEAQPLEPLLEVSVKLYQKERNRIQNSLYWVWNTIISNEWGWEKNDVHSYFIKRHLVKIYERDDEGCAEMMEAIRNVHRAGDKEKAKIMADFVLSKTSTTHATVKQFAEYLNDIEKEMIGKGFPLPHPDEYRRAMGIRK